MKRDKKPKYIALGIAVALAFVVLVALAAMPNTNVNKSIESPFSVALALEAPPFASPTNISESETEEAAVAYAFPSDKAGISAYVNVSETINVTDPKILDAFSSLSELSETHVIGVIPIDNAGKTINVNVYADTNGWLVAYFEKGTATASITSWRINPAYPEISDSVFHTAIQAFCGSADIDYTKISENIKYYHFAHPDADKMIVFMNTIIGPESAGTSERIYFSIPSEYGIPYVKPVLKELSYSLFCMGGDWDDHVRFYRDGSELAYVPGPTRETWGTFSVSYGDPHILELRVTDALESGDWGGLCVFVVTDNV